MIELGRVEVSLGRPETALEAYQRSAAMHRQIGDRAREATAFDATGEAYRELNRFGDAAEFHRLAAATFREFGDRWHLALSLVNLGVALHGTGAVDESDHCLREADELLITYHDPRARTMRATIARLSNRADPGRPTE